jgi:hypothetical protein
MKSPFTYYQLKQFGCTVLPAFAVVLLPKCPLCWMTILSTLGLSSVISAAWLNPLALLFLALAIAGIAFRAYRRRIYGPLVLGISAAILIYVSKFTFGFDAGAYVGGAILMGASFWNARPMTIESENPACCDQLP